MNEQGVAMNLFTLRYLQNNKCYYCKCEMEESLSSPYHATIEHLLDKWSSPQHEKIQNTSNLVAACHRCNNARGAVRNRIARAYYKDLAMKRGMKLAVASTSSKTLYKLFGPVPQHLFE
jgi:hypothetical protein